MPVWIRLMFLICLWPLVLTLNGCDSAQSQLDDKKEPHYILGESRVNAMDYQGAIEAFEESLEVDPHSAAAHFQLACLYDEKVSNPAAAIYHYEEYLKYDPDADNAEVVTQRINSCKRQLAADVMAMPSTPAAQQQLEKLIEQNQQLQDQLAKWQAYANQLQAKLDAISAAPQPTPAAVQPLPENYSQTAVATPVRSESTVTASPRPRTHVVARGETEAAIARKYGVSLSAMEAANPGVRPTKLYVGQILNVP